MCECEKLCVSDEVSATVIVVVLEVTSDSDAREEENVAEGDLLTDVDSVLEGETDRESSGEAVFDDDGEGVRVSEADFERMERVPVDSIDTVSEGVSECEIDGECRVNFDAVRPVNGFSAVMLVNVFVAVKKRLSLNVRRNVIVSRSENSDTLLERDCSELLDDENVNGNVNDADLEFVDAMELEGEILYVTSIELE